MTALPHFILLCSAGAAGLMALLLACWMGLTLAGRAPAGHEASAEAVFPFFLFLAVAAVCLIIAQHADFWSAP
ncbi:hypothetical protein [Phreatobacter stygius]|uniref:hypothetical protein n=1 Tax=Phreatobacter stygius TaxID=1940610 RepID=UPI001476DDB1|nr:hypothetical protein [Phreatobacter stygius]